MKIVEEIICGIAVFVSIAFIYWVYAICIDLNKVTFLAQVPAIYSVGILAVVLTTAVVIDELPYYYYRYREQKLRRIKKGHKAYVAKY
ncbi:MAG: hypothetical protein NTX00_02345 [Candidatus Parcubacteria bacterium]|nr:hypothetical protein [Candidatus Parcubacteria bacterium]